MLELAEVGSNGNGKVHLISDTYSSVDFGSDTTILPTQFADLWRRRSDISPEVVLLLNFLGRNIRDYLLLQRSHRNFYLTARRWFESDSYEPFSFYYTCEHTGIRSEILMDMMVMAQKNRRLRDRLLRFFSHESQ